MGEDHHGSGEALVAHFVLDRVVGPGEASSRDALRGVERSGMCGAMLRRRFAYY